VKKQLILLALLSVGLKGFSQKLSKKDASILIDKTLTYLKVSDELAFMHLWQLTTSEENKHQVAFSNAEIKEHFKEMKIFLDTAITKNLSPTISIEKLNKVEGEEYSATHKLTACFVFDTFITKCLAFYLVNNKANWYYRFSPDYIQYSKH
jgi:hypothetical protein